MNGDIENSVCELFDFCGCGVPEVVVRQLKKYLHELTLDWGERRPDHDDAFWLMAYLCDLHGLTDHGSSVCSAWLTDSGKEWVKKLDAYEEEK